MKSVVDHDPRSMNDRPKNLSASANVCAEQAVIASAAISVRRIRDWAKPGFSKIPADPRQLPCRLTTAATEESLGGKAYQHYNSRTARAHIDRVLAEGSITALHRVMAYVITQVRRQYPAGTRNARR